MMSTLHLLVAFAVFLCYSNATPTVDPSPETDVLGAGEDNIARPRQAPVPCTTPAQWEGRFSEWDHIKSTNNRYLVSFDGVQKRKYLEEEQKSMRPGRRLFKFLIFYNEKVEYMIDEKYNMCTKRPMGIWQNYSIPPTALFEDNYMVGGPKGGLNVSEWSDRQPARTRESWIGGFTVNGCWPVFEIFTFKNDTTSMGFTTRFFDISLGIKNISIFDLPKICNSAATTPTPETSLWDRWAPGWLKNLLGKQKIDNGGIEVPQSDDVSDATPWMVNEDSPTRMPMIPVKKSKSRPHVRKI